MRSKVVRTLALALLICGVGMAIAQQPSAPPSGSAPVKEGRSSKPKQKPAPAKSKLEEMLAEALKNNPDIRVAAAKLAEADAELSRTRLQVMQKVVTLYHAIETQKKIVEHAEKQDKRAQNSGTTIPTKDLDEIRQTLALAKAKLEELEAQQPALLGKTPQAEHLQAIQLDEGTLRLSPQRLRTYIEEAVWEKAPKTTGPMAEKIRKALSRPISVSFTNHPIKEVADLLSKETGLVIQFVGDPSFAPAEKVAIRFDNLSLASALQLLEDSLPRHTIVVRDYGLLIATKQSVPPGAISVQEFLRPKPTEPARKGTANEQSSNAGLPWDPPSKIEGTVKEISSLGWIVITFNSVDGLLNGHTLFLYRPSDEPSKAKYLGTIRIVNYYQKQGNEAMGQAIGRLTEPPKVGDKVSVRKPSGGKNPPAENVEGLVKSVDASGLIKISIGSDAGLAKGHTLELFRLNASSPKESKYLGTIRILEAQAKESVAQAVGRLADTPKAGDRVASRILGK